MHAIYKYIFDNRCREERFFDRYFMLPLAIAFIVVSLKAWLNNHDTSLGVELASIVYWILS